MISSSHTIIEPDSIEGLSVLIMGLGLNRGGLEAARWFVEAGAKVTVTDLRSAEALAPSIESLKDYDIRYVLGRHDMEDFKNADLVIKNPAVPPTSPFLKVARRIETDLSIFLSLSPARLFAITGSKGKSTTAAALAHALKALGRKVWLGGNISLSPLAFLSELDGESDVVLELSSWHLGDLRGRKNIEGESLLKPRIAIITNILRDHLDRYGSMENYVDDKKEIYRGQGPEDLSIFSDDDSGAVFASESPARVQINSLSSLTDAMAERLANLSPHLRENLRSVALALLDLGYTEEAIAKALSTFTGIPHRLEFFADFRGRHFYNDSAATVPEASAMAITSLEKPLILIAGGNDKCLDFRPLAEAAKELKALVLLAGTGTDQLIPLLEEQNITWEGPFSKIDSALETAWNLSAEKDSIVLSPGATSFGLFLNEFDRGDRWKEAVARLIAREGGEKEI